MATMQGQETEYKPWGMLAGNMVGKRETDIDAANMLELQNSQLGNVLKSIEAERASADYNDPRMEALRQQGIMGENMTKDTQGRLKQGTLSTDISSGNAKNTAEQGANEIKTMIDGFTRLSADLESASAQYGPAGLSQILPKLPPELQQVAQQLQQAGQLDKFPLVINKLRDHLVQQAGDTPAVRGKLIEQEQKYGQDVGLAQMNNVSKAEISAADNAARLEAARIAAAARKASDDKMVAEKIITGRMAALERTYKSIQEDETILMDKLGQARMTAYKGNSAERLKQKTEAIAKIELDLAAVKGRKAEVQRQAQALQEQSAFGAGSTEAPAKQQGNVIKLD